MCISLGKTPEHLKDDKVEHVRYAIMYEKKPGDYRSWVAKRKTPYKIDKWYRARRVPSRRSGFGFKDTDQARLMYHPGFHVFNSIDQAHMGCRRIIKTSTIGMVIAKVKVKGIIACGRFLTCDFGDENDSSVWRHRKIVDVVSCGVN